MRIDWYTLALQTVNFAVLVWLLHRLLYRPVLRMVDARQEHIAAQQSAARDALAQAKDELAGITAARSSIAAERAQALASASAEADALKRARIASAEQEAATCLDEGRKKLASEREQALAGVRFDDFVIERPSRTNAQEPSKTDSPPSRQFNFRAESTSLRTAGADERS